MLETCLKYGRRFVPSCNTLVSYLPAFFLWLIFSLSSSIAYADACAGLQAQLRSIGRAADRSSGPEAGQLRRQLAAIRGLERQRQCSSKKSGGFFDPCRDLAKRRADVQRQIDGTAGRAGGNAAALRARFAALGCRSSERSERRQEARRAGPGRTVSVKNTMLFCVRLADGYFFPAPNSQFVGVDHVENTLDRCRYICGTRDVEVYKLDDMALESEEMASVPGGRSYRDLPSAFGYREAAHFEGCDFGRYYQRVNEGRARSVTPENMDAAIIPLPSARPEPQALASTPGVDPTITSDSSPERNVRVVLPGFLPGG